jgi:glutathionyl-hydroquinone reductase
MSTSGPTYAISTSSRGIAHTVKMDQIRADYYGTHQFVNPSGIVAAMPELDFNGTAE